MKETNSHEPTDEALCLLVSEGDTSAEDELVRRYVRLVRICARPLFLSGGDSEDLIQEGMLGLLSAVRSYSPCKEASFHTFAEVCIRNRLHSAIRAAKGGKHSPLNDCISFEVPLLESVNFHLLTSKDNPEQLVINREEVNERLHQLRKRLSNFEQVILSHYLSGLSCSEIATKVHKTPKSVDNAVQRIRKKLSNHQSA